MVQLVPPRKLETGATMGAMKTTVILVGDGGSNLLMARMNHDESERNGQLDVDSPFIHYSDALKGPPAKK